VLQRVTGVNKGLHGVTRGDRGLQGITRGFKESEVVTKRHKGLQRFTNLSCQTFLSAMLLLKASFTAAPWYNDIKCEKRDRFVVLVEV